MADVVQADDTTLKQLKDALATAGQEYKFNLARLTNLIEEITSGDIQGAPANDLLVKFQEKQETLNNLEQTIEEAEEYMGLQTNKLEDMLEALKGNMN